MPWGEATGQCLDLGGVRGAFAATALKVHLGVPRTSGLLPAIHAEGLGLGRSAFQPHQALLEVDLLHIFRVLSPARPVKATAKPTQSPAEPLCWGQQVIMGSPSLPPCHGAASQRGLDLAEKQSCCLNPVLSPIHLSSPNTLANSKLRSGRWRSNFACFKQGAFPISCASSFPAGTLQVLGDARYRREPANKG